MRNFKIYIGVVLIFLVISTALSQNPKIEKARANFIAQKLQLSSADAQKFWPVYNEYADKIKSVRQERMSLFKTYDYSQNPAEAEMFLKKYNQLEVLEAQTKSDYIKRFNQIIGVVKTAHLFKAEEEFRLELIKILKDNKTD